jgi:hypothetical protein
MSIEELLTLHEDALLDIIGRATFDNQVASRAEMPPEVQYQLAPEYDSIEVGRRVLHRVEQELCKLVCSDDAGDVKERNSIKSAIGLGDVTVAGTLVSILTSQFGVDHTVAVGTSAFITKFVIMPAGEELCSVWRERIARFS